MKDYDLNELAKEIHQNAIDHGWWKEDRSLGEICALIHSELSEALEEYRAGHGVDEIYYHCNEIAGQTDTLCDPKDKYDCINFGIMDCCGYRAKKPEGIPVELADVCIRILDYCCKKQFDIDASLAEHRDFLQSHNFNYVIAGVSFAEQVTLYHIYISNYYRVGNIKELIAIVNCIFGWAKHHNIDMLEVVKLKHEYNKTRPYKHGGKVI